MNYWAYMSESSLDIQCECPPVSISKYRDEMDQTPTEAIVDAVGEAAGVDPIELPPLYASVDPVVIEKLLKGDNRQMIIGIQYNSWNVFVRGDGAIQVCDRERPTEPNPVFQNASSSSQ